MAEPAISPPVSTSTATKLRIERFIVTPSRASLVVRATGDRVALATFIRYEHRLAHLVWPPLSAIHRHLVPGVLRNAVNRVSFGLVDTEGNSQ